MTDPPESRRWLAFRLAIVAAICAVGAIRITSVGLLFLPHWLAWVLFVTTALELASAGWNLVRRRPWNEKTLLDAISDALVYLPWP